MWLFFFIVCCVLYIGCCVYSFVRPVHHLEIIQADYVDTNVFDRWISEKQCIVVRKANHQLPMLFPSSSSSSSRPLMSKEQKQGYVSQLHSILSFRREYHVCPNVLFTTYKARTFLIQREKNVTVRLYPPSQRSMLNTTVKHDEIGWSSLKYQSEEDSEYPLLLKNYQLF